MQHIQITSLKKKSISKYTLNFSCSSLKIRSLWKLKALSRIQGIM